MFHAKRVLRLRFVGKLRRQVIVREILEKPMSLILENRFIRLLLLAHEKSVELAKSLARLHGFDFVRVKVDLVQGVGH